MSHYDRFFLASDIDAEGQRDQLEVLRVLQASPNQADKIAQYFYERTRKLILLRSFTVSGKGVKIVDLVRDVLRYVPLYWTATELVCGLAHSGVADKELTWSIGRLEAESG